MQGFVHIMGEKMLGEVVGRVKIVKYFLISVDSHPI